MNANACDLRNHPGQFMTEDGRGHDHFSVVAAFEDFQVGPAGERRFDTDADFAGFEGGRRNLFDRNFFPAVQDGGFHPDSLRVRATAAILVCTTGLTLHVTEPEARLAQQLAQQQNFISRTQSQLFAV